MSVVAYQCTACGGELAFNPAKGAFVCEYCGSTYTEDVLKASGRVANEQQIEQENQAPADGEELALYHCPNCGGEVMADDTTAATTCYYCHSPVVLSGRLGGKFLPKRIIPFQFPREQAVDKFYAWTKSKFFLPKDFFSTQSIENLTGVYFPYWIIDADADVQLQASCETTDSWTIGDTTYTKHRIYDCTRRADIHLEDIVKSALSKHSKTLVESIQPFDESLMQPFNMAYLSGFQAERRDTEPEDIDAEVQENIAYYSKNAIRDTIHGYDSVDETGYHCSPTHIDWEYGLLPVWVMTYLYKNETYYFAMNGESGNMTGKLPVATGKLRLVSALIGIASFMLSNALFSWFF